MTGDSLLPPPPPQRGGPLPPPPAGPPQGPAGAAPKPWWKRWWIIALGALVVIGIIAAIAGAGASDDDDADDDAAGDGTEAPATEVPGTEAPGTEVPGTEVPATEAAGGEDESASSEASGESGEVSDVGPCTMVDAETVLLDVTNNSSEQSSYIIDVNYLDENGERVGDESFFINYIRPGEHALEESFALSTAGGATCEVAEVERFSAESPDDVAEVTCEVTGVDVLDDISTALTATNSSSELSDYLITAALVRDGTRIGTVTAVIENIDAGESAPGEGFSTVNGPADGVTCEVVYVAGRPRSSRARGRDGTA